MIPRSFPTLALLLLALPSAAQTRKLSGRLARDSAGSLYPYAFASAGGGSLVYFVAPDDSGVFETRSVALDGKHAPVRLPDGGFMGLSPDGKRALLASDPDGDGRVALHAIAADGVGPLVPLSRPLAPGGWFQYLQSSTDGVHVVYAAEQDSEGVVELFAVPQDGSAPPHRLSGALVAGGGVRSCVLSGDGRVAVYQADPEVDERYELFVVPVDGSAPARKLDLPLVAGGEFLGFWLDVDGARLVYAADQEEDERYELFSVRTDGSEPARKLNGALVPEGDVGERIDGQLYATFQLSFDGRWVVYPADQEEDERFELFSVPADGSRPAAKLSRAEDRAVSLAAVSYDSAWVVYSSDPSGADARELLSAPIDGSAPARALSGPMVPGGDAFFPQISFDSRNVVWEADQLVDEVHELFGAPIDGSAPPRRLNAPFVSGGDLNVDRRNLLPGFWVMEAGAIYEADQEVDGLVELYFAPFPLGSPARKLASGPVDAALPLAGFLALPPDDFARVAVFGRDALFAVGVEPGASALELDVLPQDRVVGDVSGFQLAPDGARALYQAREEGDTSSDLYSVSTGERREAVQLHPEGLRVQSVLLSPDGTRVALEQGPAAGPSALYGGPADGSGPQVLLYPADVEDPFFGPDGARVFFLAPVAGQLHLFSVPSDGSTPAAWLSAALPSDRGVRAGARTSADGDWIAFRSSGTVAQLHVAPTDGSSPAVRVSAGGQSVLDFGLAGDGARAFFRTDTTGPRQGELFVAPRDASLAPLRLNAPLVAFGDVDVFAVSADGTLAVYLADQSVHDRHELYAVPTDGSAAPLALSGPLTSEQDVFDFVLSPDGRRVAFRADLTTDGVDDLYSAPTDASAGPVRLGRRVLDYAIGADSKRVVFRASSTQGPVELFSAPLRGARAPRLIGRSPYPGGGVQSFRLSADASTVAFLASRSASGRRTLFVGPAGGEKKAVELAGPFPGDGTVLDYALSADGSLAAWRADQEITGVVELFAAGVPSAPLLRRR